MWKSLRRWWYWNYVKNEAWPPDVREYFVRKSLKEMAKAKKLTPQMQQDISAAEMGAALCGKPGDLSPELKLELLRDGFRHIAQIPHEPCAVCGRPVPAHLAKRFDEKFYHESCAKDAKIAEYSEALRSNPEGDGAHLGLGRVLSLQGHLEGAISEFRRALWLNAENVDAHVALGWELHRTGERDQAVVEFRKALSLNPDKDEAHVGLGCVLSINGDLDGSIAEFREAVRANPRNDDAHYYLGKGLEEKGEREEALQEYSVAIQLNPKAPNFRYSYERLSRATKR